MADILKYTYDVSDINYRYQEIHNEIFRLSVRKLAMEMFADQNVPLKEYEDDLKMLYGKLTDIQTALDVLPQNELNIRSGKEILSALSNYVAALTKSIHYLEKICNDKKNLLFSDSNFVNDKKAYDDAIQHHKNLGVILNSLLSDF